MKPFSSHKGISHPSPHNIYCVGSWLSLGLRTPSCHASASTGVPSLVAIAYHGLPSEFPSPLSEYQQSLIGFENHGLPVVGALDRAGPTSENGIIPITDRTFLSSVPDRPGGAGCYRLSRRCTKKRPAPYLFRERKRAHALQAAIVFALFRQPIMSCVAVPSPHPLPKISDSKSTTATGRPPNPIHFH